MYGGVPYAYASIAGPGRAGWCSPPAPARSMTAGAIAGAGDMRLQARQVVANLTEALTAAGAELADVLKTTVYVASADRADLVAVWDTVRAAFAGHDPPSTLLGVAALGYDGQLVEVEAVALISDSRHTE
jgi:enamine deaminase RidA (YjgF/YER057c/UK114 family)